MWWEGQMHYVLATDLEPAVWCVWLIDAVLCLRRVGWSTQNNKHQQFKLAICACVSWLGLSRLSITTWPHYAIRAYCRTSWNFDSFSFCTGPSVMFS